eukprot:210940_1
MFSVPLKELRTKPSNLLRRVPVYFCQAGVQKRQFSLSERPRTHAYGKASPSYRYIAPDPIRFLSPFRSAAIVEGALDKAFAVGGRRIINLVMGAMALTLVYNVFFRGKPKRSEFQRYRHFRAINHSVDMDFADAVYMADVRAQIERQLDAGLTPSYDSLDLDQYDQQIETPELKGVWRSAREVAAEVSDEIEELKKKMPKYTSK